jgi:hypothetical protein
MRSLSKSVAGFMTGKTTRHHSKTAKFVGSQNQWMKDASQRIKEPAKGDIEVENQADQIAKLFDNHSGKCPLDGQHEYGRRAGVGTGISKSGRSRTRHHRDRKK